MAIGGVGVSTEAAPPSDLDTIYLGGEYFLDRMKAMGNQTAAAKQALADLALGQEASAANAAAKSVLADAQKAKDDAVKALADANANAKSIIDAAKVQALDIVKTAQDTAARANAEAVSVKTNADEYAAKSRTDANANMSEANRMLADAERQLNATKKAEQDHLAAKAIQDAAAKAASDAKASFEKKVASIQAIIAG